MQNFQSERAVIAFLEDGLRHKKGCYHQKIYLKFTSGFPDLIVGYRGRACFYEVKPMPGSLLAAVKTFEPIQLATIAKMQEAGMVAHGLVVKDKSRAYLISVTRDCKQLTAWWVQHFEETWAADPTNLPLQGSQQFFKNSQGEWEAAPFYDPHL